MPNRADRRILTCATRADWDAWLAAPEVTPEVAPDSAPGAEAGDRADGVWLRIAKPGAPAPTVAYADALQVALCHGWIDGQKATADAGYWLQRFTPRRAGSKWSEVNRRHAEALIASGAMRPAGLREVERARADGRWDAAYAPQRTAAVPDDLAAALAADPAAAAAFAALNAVNRYAVLHRVHDAKRPETRARRIAQFVAMLAEGRTLYP